MENTPELVSEDTQEKSQPEKVYTTKEISQETGVSMDTLQFWARQEMVNPASTGEGKRKRLHWSEEDLDAVKMLRDAQRISELMKKAQAAKEMVTKDQIIAAGMDGVRLIEKDAPVASVLKRVGPFCVLLA